MSRDPSRHDDIDALVADARSGGRADFDRLAGRCRGMVRRWAVPIVGDPDEAEDVAQAVLLRLHRYLESYDSSGRFHTWLYRVTRNAALDHMGDAREEAGTDEAVDKVPRPLSRLYERQLTDLVAVFFEELPPRQRQIFDLCDLQGFEPAEIAEMLEMNPSTVRANLFKARRRIRTRILREHPELEEGYAREM